MYVPQKIISSDETAIVTEVLKPNVPKSGFIKAEKMPFLNTSCATVYDFIAVPTSPEAFMDAAF